MRSILAIVLGVLSAAAVLGTGACAAASDGNNGDGEVLLTKEQWDGMKSFASECTDRGRDSHQTALDVAERLETAIGPHLDAREINAASAETMASTLAWMLVQSLEIERTVEGLRAEGATGAELREVVRPMAEYYRVLSSSLSGMLDAEGLSCYIPRA